MTSVELTDGEKKIFLDWIQQREKLILDELELLKSLLSKLSAKPEVKEASSSNLLHQPIKKANLFKKADDSFSWIDTIKKELDHFSHPVQSGEIVNRLLQKPSLSHKSKRFITKAVTSKLWLLQERGEVIKTRENSRYVYSLKK